MNGTPRSERLHIAIFGKRNVGKSSLINVLTNQDLALVADVPGTTTDPVMKSMEILPLGPVVIIDTAGYDDFGELGDKRVKKTYDVLKKVDLAILVVDAFYGVQKEDIDFINLVKSKEIDILCVINKIDECDKINHLGIIEEFKIPVVKVSAKRNIGIEELKNKISQSIKDPNNEKYIVRDLINEGDYVVLVTPIDSAAPKGRLILPQQQTISDIIDKNAIAIVTQEDKLEDVLNNVDVAMVITDSQAFDKVSKVVPRDVSLTSFSILFARYKGELRDLVSGIDALYKLKKGDKVLIAEGCTHHRQGEDIGKFKIPNWIREVVGDGIEYEWISGNSSFCDIEKFKLIIHCGGCMLNDREMKYRLQHAKDMKVPIVNYGVLIAKINGVLDRALEPILKNTNILDNNV